MRDVVKLVRRVAHDLGRNPIAAGRLRLQLTEMDAAVDVGETDLDRLIANLVDNALKYSPGGEPIDVVVESDIAGVVVRDPIMASDSGQP
jgi:signal transduction histidine kinase